MKYLVFRLYGPMASWGEIAVGGERRSALHPSRSAILGLLGAALGIDRYDDEKHKSLSSAFVFGGKLLCSGDILKDYHTSQVSKTRKGISYTTRKEELLPSDINDVGTILSSREYRTDAVCIIALSLNDSSRYKIEEILDALKKPKFHLYLGRKSCPLGCPLEAKIIESDSLKSVLDNSEFNSLKMYKRNSKKDDQKLLNINEVDAKYFWEECENSGMKADMQVIRYDNVDSRKRWQFSPRKENIAFVSKGGS